MQLTRLAVVRPLTVLMGLLGLVIMGGVSYTFLKIDRLPPISIPFVSVSMAYTGATAQDVELLITEPIENAVSGMSGVNSITSTSSEGSANIFVQLVDGADPTQASLEVERRVNAIRSDGHRERLCRSQHRVGVIGAPATSTVVRSTQPRNSGCSE